MLIITEHRGQITALVNLGYDPELSHTYRVKVAESVGAREAATGAQLYIFIAKTCTSTDWIRLDLLSKAYALARGPAADALADFALKKRILWQIRLKAVKIAGPELGTQRTIDLCTTIVTTTDDNATALDAAREVVAMNRDLRDLGDLGRRLMGELADRSNANTAFQLNAAAEAGVYGIPALTRLASPAQSDTVQLKAAQAMSLIDWKKAEPVLQRLVEKHRAGNVRIDAAFTLRGKSAVDALITIVRDRGERDTIRFDAAVKAEAEDKKRARQELLVLVDAPGISEEVREKYAST